MEVKERGPWVKEKVDWMGCEVRARFSRMSEICRQRGRPPIEGSQVVIRGKGD